MGTATKTFKENILSTQQATWTVSVTHADMTVSDSTLKFTAPTLSVKYVYPNRDLAYADIVFRFGGSGSSVTDDGEFYTGSNNFIALTSNTTKALTFKNLGLTTNSVSTSLLFNSSNRTSKTVPIYVHTSSIHLESQQSNSSNANIYSGYYETIGPVFNLTLNAPPTVTYDNPTYAPPQYAGLGAYSVDVTQAKAQYQGYVSSITLTIGTDSVTQTYSATTVTNKTISVIPTVGGTYTPTLKVTDSRGQTTTVSLPQITVNPYNAPSLDFDVFRTDSSGVRADEGAYGLITANISFTDAVADITEPTVQINGTTTSNVTWYSAYNATTGVSSAISDWSTVSNGDTVYGLINGSFTQTDSYQITITLEDSLGGESSAITQTLSTAFYTIDFQAGGKEIVFGGPAKDDLTNYPNGLFKCEMDIIGRGFLDYFYPVGSYYETSDVTFNPNTKWGGTWVLETEGQVHVSGSVSGTYQISGAPTDTNDGGATDAIIPYHNHGFTQPTISSHTHPAAEGKGFLEYDGNITITSKRAYTAANSSGVIYIVASNNPGITRNTTTGTRQPTASGGAVQYAGTNGNRTNANMQPYIIVNRWHRTA